VRLVVIGPDKQITEIKIGTWKHAQKDYRYSFAMLRIPRNSRAGQLVFSVINQNEFSMGKLVMLSSKNLDDLIALSKEKKYESQNLLV